MLKQLLRRRLLPRSARPRRRRCCSRVRTPYRVHPHAVPATSSKRLLEGVNAHASSWALGTSRSIATQARKKAEEEAKKRAAAIAKAEAEAKAAAEARAAEEAKAKAQAKGLVAAVAIKQAKDQEAAVAEASKKAEAVTTCVELSRSLRNGRALAICLT